MKSTVRIMSIKNILIFFVTAPAWKVFSLFMLPIILFVISPFILSKALLIFSMWTVLLWVYSIGVLLHEKYSQYLSISLIGFKICLIYCALYSPLFMSESIPFDYLMPLHLVSFGCNIYTLYFISKLIVLVERKSVVRFQDYIGTFFLAWFYLIGIWFIQPRVTKLFLSNDV